MAMELPDEALVYNYQNLLVQPGEEWTLAAETRAKHFLHPNRLKELLPRLNQCRSQVAGEREIRTVAPEALPVDSAFIDLPQQLLDGYRRKQENSDLGRIIALGARLRNEVDRVVLLGAGGGHLPGKALFEALKSTYHNELPPEHRLGSVPRLYFEGTHCDNDSLQDLLDVVQITCVDPEQRDERWAVVVLSPGSADLEPAVAHRVFRREAAEYYGLRSERLHTLFAAAAPAQGRVRDLFRAYGHGDEAVLPVPDHVGGRFTAFTAAGLLPAALMNLDLRALLLGALAMTKRFLEEPFERNPVLQFAAVNYLMYEEVGKPFRVLSVWSRKLETLGLWYDQLVAESLGKFGRGPTPLTVVQPRDLHTRGQHHQEGPRDRVINNLVVKSPRAVPIGVSMADNNQDELNQYARKGLPDIVAATHRAVTQCYHETARPTADLVMPSLTEHTMGQLMQLLMLATVVEGRLMGINPYTETGVEAYQRARRDLLRG